ncbi:MAG TPA: hypothetical protein VMX37_07460, partial [Acidimicrobiia bacterium]|nr:hypothetical protein [Acidimicrobiia bacterium]
MRRHVALAVATLLATGCSVGAGVPGATVTSTTTPATTTSTTEPAPVLCVSPTLLPAPTGETEVRRLSGANPVAAAIALSSEVYQCSPDVVVVSTADLNRVALAARLAAALDGPLLFARSSAASALEAELARLIPQRVWQVGGDVEVGLLPEGTELEVLSGDPWRLAEEVGRQVAGSGVLALPAEGGVATVAVAVQAMVEGSALEPPAPSTATTVATTTTAAATTSTVTTTTSPAGGEAGSPAEPVPVVVAGTGERGVAWLVEAGEPALALAAAAATSSGSLLALVDGTDLRLIPEVGRALR